jgi:RNA:NAD 2'-phosphotransferase (TPT1/KptA family)
VTTLTRHMLDAARSVPEKYDVVIDVGGFIELDEFLKGFNKTSEEEVTREDLEDVLQKNPHLFITEEDRFAAITGHSPEVVPYPIKKPPRLLYACDNGSFSVRHPLYLSVQDAEDSLSKKQKTRNAIISVEAEKAYMDGVPFYFFHGRWYFDGAPLKYLALIDMLSVSP